MKEIIMGKKPLNTIKPNPNARTRQGYYDVINEEKYRGAKTIIYRSSWEKQFFKICDMNSRVIEWASEPLKIPYFNPIKKKQAIYIPDVLMNLKTDKGNVVYLIEIKPTGDLKKPPPVKSHKKASYKTYDKRARRLAVYAINMAKFAAAKKFCDKRGWKFLVLTENYFNKMFG